MVRRILAVYGTRQEAGRAAPLIAELDRSAAFAPMVAVTGQHRTEVGQVNALFGIAPQFVLDIHRPGLSLADVTSRALRGVRALLTTQRPDAVVVQGGSTTGFAAALAAFHEKIPVVHLAGSAPADDLYSPYPDEVNQRLAAQLAALHLAPTTSSKAGLVAGNADPASVVVTGSTVVDALRWTAAQQPGYGDLALAGLDSGTEPVLLVAARWREAWAGPRRAMDRALARIAQQLPGLRIVVPVDASPLVRTALMPAAGHLPNVTVTGPLPYGGFARLMRRAKLILTDSGEVLEEGASLGTPVLVMRDTTEHAEAVRAGSVRLVGTDGDVVSAAVGRLFIDRGSYDRMAGAANPFGDGKAAPRCVAAIAHHLGLGPAPDEFAGIAATVTLPPQALADVARIARRGGLSEESRQLVPGRPGGRPAAGHRPGGRGVRVPHSRYGCLSAGERS
jgi:UDP-N-acetylglucosamine 2-epimerase (non-hydrolysing)